MTSSDIDAVAGLYRNTTTGAPAMIVRDKDGVRLERGGALIAMSGAKFLTAGHATWEFDGAGRARVLDEYGSTDTYERVRPAAPTAAQLQEYAGTYASAEAETTLLATVEGDSLVFKQRPATTVRLTPVYADAFTGSQLGTVVFRRDGSGRVSGLSVSQDRVWDLRFTRVDDPKKTSQ
jgi:hypothetical protein